VFAIALYFYPPGLSYCRTGLIDSTIQKVVNDTLNNETRSGDTPDESSVVRFCLPFKGQTAANAVRKQMVDLSRKVGVRVQPVFTSRKLEQQLKPREVKAPIVNKQQAGEAKRS
jgi:hypothetical protein